MAIETQKIIRDDLDGSIIDEETGGTCSFMVFGEVYDLELSEKNKQKLLAALQPFIAVARPRTAVARPRPAPTPRVNVVLKNDSEITYEMKDAREWLVAQGHTVPVRGRVPQRLLSIYEDNLKSEGK